MPSKVGTPFAKTMRWPSTHRITWVRAGDHKGIRGTGPSAIGTKIVPTKSFRASQSSFIPDTSSVFVGFIETGSERIDSVG